MRTHGFGMRAELETDMFFRKTRDVRLRARPGEIRTARQRRSNQRSRPGDRRKMVTKHDPLVCRHEISTVLKSFGWGCTGRIQREHLTRDDLAIEPIANEVSTDRGRQQPRSADFFAVVQGDGGEGASTEYGGR